MRSHPGGLLSLTLAVTLLVGCSGASLPGSRTPTPRSTLTLTSTPTGVGLPTTLPVSPTPTPRPTLAPLATPTKTDVAVSVNHITYQIEGSTAGELRAQMDQLGPADESGRFDAYTRWVVSWSYPYSTQDGTCTTGPVNVRVRITFTLPQWNVPSDASQALIDRWAAYMTALQTHEDGHKEIGIQAGHDILRTLEGLPSYPTCDELEEAADAAGESVLDRYRERETIYDQTTRHGATQGARFP